MLLTDFLDYANIHADETRKLVIKLVIRGQGRVSNMEISEIKIGNGTITVYCYTNEQDDKTADFAINYLNATDEERRAADAVFKNPVMF